MSAAVMVCGTASDVGKSRLVTGILRAFSRRGLAAAPFKGQNMALNSIVTPLGAEIGRAQGVQARAAGVVAEAAMNPVLLKPMSDRRSQVVVLGRPWKELDAVAYQGAKSELQPIVLGALEDLRARHELVVCEGAGSPAEVNLFDGDLVNLGIAVRAGIPAVVVGDIDRGGVFAHLFGTVALLPEERRAAVRGFVVNKLRGDPQLLGDATGILERRCGVPTIGVVPYVDGLWLDAEDSLGLGWQGDGRFDAERAATDAGRAPRDAIDVAIVRLPHISNFTDADPLAAEPAVSVRLVADAGSFGDPDLVVVPGSKSTVSDLAWLRRRGLDRAIEGACARATTVVGICGGYQMLGHRIEDPHGVEAVRTDARAGSVPGLGLLPLETRFAPEKVTACRTGRVAGGGMLAVEGYEIHHGRHFADDGAPVWFELDAESRAAGATEPEGIADGAHGCFGSALHGLFDADGFRARFLSEVAERRGKCWEPSGLSFAALCEEQIDLLADVCECHIDLDRLLEIAGEAK